MANKITCTCGHSWNKSDSSKKDAYVCHICGKDNTMKNGGWLDAYDDEMQLDGNVYPVNYIPQAQDGTYVKQPRTDMLTMDEYRVQKAKQSTVTKAEPKRSTASKALAIASNPMTALSYKVKGQNIPENFERGDRNRLDYAIDILNPFSYIDQARQVKEDVGKGNYLAAGISALGLVPGEGAIERGSSKFLHNKKGISLEDFESAINNHLSEGLGIKKGSENLTVKVRPGDLYPEIHVAENAPKFTIDLYNEGRSSGFVGLDKLNTADYDIPGQKGTIYTKVADYPYQFSRRGEDALKGSGISGEFNKAITNALQEYELGKLYSSTSHTDEGLARWQNLVKKGKAVEVGKNRFKLLKEGGYIPQAENGIEGTMGGLTDVGFNYNGAWGGTMAMGGSMPGAVGFTYARTGSIPSNGPYAKKTKASAQDGRAISDNTRLKPIVTEKPMNRETVSSSNDSYAMSPQEALLNKLKGVRLKESQDRLNKTAEKITAVGSLSPNPFISVPSGIVNFTLGVTDAPTPGDAGLDYMGLLGSVATPSSLRGFKKIGRRAPFFKAIGAADALSDIFEFTPSEDLPKKQNGGEMKYYQEGLDWKPRNISQEGSKTSKKKKTLVLAEHDPGRWDNPDGSPATNINPFITEAAGIKKYVNKYFPGEDVEVIPTYKQNIKEALAKSDPNTRLVVMGHSGDKMFGIPTTEFIESVGNTKYENCYAGICYGDILEGIGKRNPDKELIGKMIPGRFPESYNLNNFNIRSNEKQWIGFAPVDRGGEEGFRDSFFRRTKNPEVNKLEEQLKQIWASTDGDYDKKVKSARPIEDKINRIYSQNKQVVNLPKAADTKELDYIPIPARTANYGKDPLRFNPQALLQNRRDGGEIPQAQVGTMLAPITGEDVSRFFDLFSVPQKAVTKLVTGKYQTPSEAMNIKNPAGAFATDMILDPTNLMGAGIVGKAAKASTKSGALSKAYKYNPLAFKPNPEANYRMLGSKGYDDALESGVIRPPQTQYPSTNFENAFYNKGYPLDTRFRDLTGRAGYEGPYMAEVKGSEELFVNDNPYGYTGPMFADPVYYSKQNIPIDKEGVKFYKEDWLQGYKKVKQPKKQNGGEIPVDPMGYWNPDNIGEPVIIPSNEITMQGVYEPLLGISDTGDVQYMEPGEDYEFDGEYVTEYPMAKSGMSVNNADAQPIEKLDQLFNFTNYNKPTKGGWLDKYK